MSGRALQRDERAALVALLTLPGMGPARIDALRAAIGSPVAVWQAVVSGRLGAVPLPGVRNRGRLLDGWRQAARARSAEEILAAHDAAGVRVVLPCDPDWPRALVDDPHPPAALFVAGRLELVEEVSVAVVGTRRCTAAGAEIARRFGAGLAAAGLPVVSGLAMGIDGAAHRGTLEGGGRPVGVVGTGLDVVYPRRHTELWATVGSVGVLVSEAPLGTTADRWRFPARNRLIAALASAVVVVESPFRGGSMTTAAAALDRSTPVLAVPGSVLSPQSQGTNQLIFDGGGMARDVADVLAELGTAAPLVPTDAISGGSQASPSRDDPVVAAVLAALAPTPSGIEAIAETAGLTIVQSSTALARLEAAGLARRDGSGYRRVVTRATNPSVP